MDKFLDFHAKAVKFLAHQRLSLCVSAVIGLSACCKSWQADICNLLVFSVIAADGGG